ncbi:FYVE, RhoGEF and PH domain-containing protein 3-like, partial [Neomonachus schauinslandi]|uniref:FYVE, RhoGEF and PH domain-containing protein 3-like n=1 Tax=Neomonachus schauinslandi TaxID=29088 RepID=A0A2Y9GU37_NEOSC
MSFTTEPCLTLSATPFTTGPRPAQPSCRPWPASSLSGLLAPLTLYLSRLQFNSMILYCVPKLRLMGQKFSVREKMDISGLQVQDIVKPNAAHTFIITGRRRSLELQTRTEEEKKEWIQVIEATIERHRQNSQTFKAFSGSFSQDEDPSLAPDSP